MALHLAPALITHDITIYDHPGLASISDIYLAPGIFKRPEELLRSRHRVKHNFISHRSHGHAVIRVRWTVATQYSPF